MSVSLNSPNQRRFSSWGWFRYGIGGALESVNRHGRRWTVVAAAIGLGLSVSACASDEQSAASPNTDGPTEPRECEPVNVELEPQASQRVIVGANDFAFGQPEYRAEAGIVTFDVRNEGEAEHELAFLPGGGDVPHVNGEPDEAALEAAGAFELEAFGPDQSCSATYELAAGTYTLFCIVEADDGQTHYAKGMKSTLFVT